MAMKRCARALALTTAFAFLGINCAQAQTKSVALAQVTVTPNSAAYSAGQCLGGVLTLPNMVQPQGLGGTLLGAVTFVDPQHQSAANDALNILFFNKLPTGTYTDHANCQVAAADAPNLVGVLSIVSSNCVQDQGPTTTICTLIPGGGSGLPLNAPMPIAASTLWAVAIVAATPTYGASASLFFTFAGMPFSP
jgi:hypothetical protein